jgi:uncharacterized protein with HEPN domain
MTRNTILYLQDIIYNMRLAEQFVDNLTQYEFTKDRKTVYAVLRCLEVIGEAVKSVPGSIREQYPGVPWKDMAGMRDRLIHFYFGVSDEKVWRTVKEDLPGILPLIEQALKELQPGS